MGSSEELNVTGGQTAGDIDPRSVVTSEEQLRELYRAPSRIAASNRAAVLDEARIGIIERSPFVSIGTSGADGDLDCDAPES